MLLAVGVHVNKHATKIAYDLMSDVIELLKKELPKLATRAQTIAGHTRSFTVTIPRVEGDGLLKIQECLTDQHPR